jgi:hypothetical protein
MSRCYPKSGEIYEHFKGNEYRIIGIAKTKKFNSLYVPDYFAKDSETQEILEVFRVDNELLISLPSGVHLENQKYVIYQQVNNLKNIWSRDLKNFLEKVDNKDRFTLVDCVVIFN